jgi:6-pyruvoyltetrahydropterin/6-carboxytetrahydropterin synthase
MSESFHVRIAKPGLGFSSAHFITYADNVCERLHGHNYTVAAEITGPLNENHYVVDFVAVREALATIVAELDHRVLLPTEHPTIEVTEEEREVVATFADRRWVFPREDCVLLPVANTTAELLARWIGGRLEELLPVLQSIPVSRLQIEVDECAGQVGVWRR